MVLAVYSSFLNIQPNHNFLVKEKVSEPVGISEKIIETVAKLVSENINMISQDIFKNWINEVK